MATTEYIESLKISENVFELQEDTTFGYLSHYAAPYTGGEEIVVPAGVRFAAYGPMRDDALYMELIGENEDLHALMVEQEKAECPQLANRLMGFSFFITEREFDVRKVLKKLWEWNIFSNFIGDNQRVTNKYPFP